MSRVRMIGPFSVGEDGLLSEHEALRASPIACALADEFIRADTVPHIGLTVALRERLDVLESVTRDSPLRKIR